MKTMQEMENRISELTLDLHDLKVENESLKAVLIEIRPKTYEIQRQIGNLRAKLGFYGEK